MNPLCSSGWWCCAGYRRHSSSVWLVSFWIGLQAVGSNSKTGAAGKINSLLLDEFKSEGIQVFPVLKVEDKNPIDLFMRFQRKLTYLFQFAQ